MKHHDTASARTVRLVPLTEQALDALLEEALDRASNIAGVSLPPFFLTQGWLWRFRLDQIRDDPTTAPWLVRAVYAPEIDTVVGHAGFHGPPDAAGMVEIGYTIVPEYRRQGYGRAAVAGLIDYAKASERVRTVRASVSPDNTASLALIRRFGFQQVGEQWDDEDGLELVFEISLRFAE